MKLLAAAVGTGEQFQPTVRRSPSEKGFVVPYWGLLRPANDQYFKDIATANVASTRCSFIARMHNGAT